MASAIFVWGIAQRCSASVLLRSEDHDQGRCRKEYEAAMFADLAWLGLHPHNTDFNSAEASPYRQSDSLAHYAAAVSQLSKVAHVYACDCSRQQISQQMQAAQRGPAAELCYNGRCRNRGLPLQAPGLSWRVEMPSGEEGCEDLLLGPLRQRPALQCGDLLLRDRHGCYTYNFAVVVDDLRHGINLIIRGQDLTHTVGRQLWLARALGRSEVPAFLHHPLVVDQDGQKLAKRSFAEGIGKRRERGEAPAAVLGLAAHAAGLIAAYRPLAVAELGDLFINWST